MIFFFKEINKGSIDEILIISNQKFSEDLRNITKKLQIISPTKLFILKCTLNNSIQKNIENFFKKNSNVVVVSDNYDIDTLLNRSKFVVGIRSSLLYESLQMGKDVFLLKKHNYDWDSLVLKYSNVFKDYDELILQFKKPKKITKNLIFFDRYDENKFLTYINSL